ncbi:MAG TPA: 2-oxoglutarate dehydrogenase E1 component [bacterium]|nr:2-oxoglutarate dehydrogenase E1 component [bacterium]
MRDPEELPTVLSGSNAEFLEHLFEQYLAQPDSVGPEWRDFFEGLQNGAGNGHAPAAQGGAAAAAPRVGHLEGLEGEIADLGKQSAVFQLINSYRTFGHTRARLDPLGKPHMPNAPDLSLAYFGLNEADLDKTFSTGTMVAPPIEPLRTIFDQLTRTYCGAVGAEYMPIRNQAQRRWLQEAMEGSWNEPRFDKETRRDILTKLAHAELFEKFLHTKFVGQKRFSLEGAESLIVMLDGLVEEAAELGAEEIVFGMPHRGRLNTLVNVMDKKLEYVFAEFLDVDYVVSEETGTGDVKYHKGYSNDKITRAGKKVHLSLTFNPSHLEAVNPVVEGNVRAKQDRREDARRTRIVPVLMHGDAAFAGQGLVHETLNLSQLPGYRTGGTIHIIVNNQIGFTTPPRMSRSFLYPSDVCKMLNIPILHVNGDDPEAVLHAIKLAVGFRQTFHSDIVIDLFCYRRHGHNEGDEPSFTQPLTYKLIKDHPSTLDIYSARLVEQGVLTEKEFKDIQGDYRALMDKALTTTREEHVHSVAETLTGAWSGLERGLRPKNIVLTEVEPGILRQIGEAIATLPEHFRPHPRLNRLLEARREMARGNQPMDWGMGELLAYGSLLWEGFNVRVSGQDVTRGTFSHRHANFVDVEDGKDYKPLQHMKEGQGQFYIFDSPLSEAGVLGFEYGYTLADPFCLTIWEAQFGDFANGAQVIIDQFIAASEEKWLRMSGLVMYLPHGMEGQGPEHSSARLERYLQMCAHGNLQVCNVTTPAQLFHMLRRQMHRSFRKPLILMSPKSLLRHPQAVSRVEDLVQGCFREVVYDRADLDRAAVQRLVLCSGKVYYDLLAKREADSIGHVSLVRVEQLYPFPREQVLEVVQQYPNLKELVWAQEEPKNMGAWDFVEPRLREVLPTALYPRYVGRKAASSPAVGSHHAHDIEQEALVHEALA